MSVHAAELVPPAARILTHCNTGPLACGQYGTALGVIQAAHHEGRAVHVWVDETAPDDDEIAAMGTYPGGRGLDLSKLIVDTPYVETLMREGGHRPPRQHPHRALFDPDL